MTYTDDDAFSASAILESLFRHKGKLVAFNLLVLMAAVAVILFFPRKYTSQAKVLVENRSPKRHARSHDSHGADHFSSQDGPRR